MFLVQTAGLEPATYGASRRRSTVKLHPRPNAQGLLFGKGHSATDECVPALALLPGPCPPDEGLTADPARVGGSALFLLQSS